MQEQTKFARRRSGLWEGNEGKSWHAGGAAHRAKTQVLHLKTFLAGRKFDSDDELKESVETRFTSLAADFYKQGIQTLCPVTISVSVWVVIMSKSRLKYVEFDNNEYKFCRPSMFTAKRFLLSL